MKHNIEINWLDGVAFTVEGDGNKIITDSPVEAGGGNRGIRPKMLLLASLGSCTAVDIVVIARKMQMNLKKLKIEVEGNLTETHPKVYESIVLKYIFTGEGLIREKLIKAIDLSQGKYCGVTAMLKNSVDISYEVIINPDTE
ncbi:MAG TPA: OsmC family protein [Lentimicrobium sp.]|nr:OsmC family protein [Lentimicrobium sp.]